ncbi:MAG: hypothetical protein M4579_000928 [Chaenotheca gracillima]|nr:MAG: hypothetical protein M4579_000928 [Chaenotheca gracillima]
MESIHQAGASLFVPRDDVPIVGSAPPPPGITPNFVNPERTATDALTILIVSVTISGLFMIMRLYTKGVLLRKFGWEDASIGCAWICSTATCILEIIGQRYGTGRHIWDVPLAELNPKWGMVVTGAVILYCPSMMFAKLAILIFYMRISPQKTFHYAIYATMFILVAYNLALMLSLIFACHPIEKSWNVLITEGSCIDRTAIYLSNGILNIITDLIIFVLPVPMVWGIQLPKRQKLGVLAFFSVGSLIVELNLAVVCGCLSIIKPFLRRHIPIVLGESRGSRGGYNRSAPYGHFNGSRSRSRGVPAGSAKDKGMFGGSGTDSSTGGPGTPWVQSDFKSDVISSTTASNPTGTVIEHQQPYPAHHTRSSASRLRALFAKDDALNDNDADLEMAALREEGRGHRKANTTTITGRSSSEDCILEDSKKHPSEMRDRGIQDDGILRTVEVHVE